MIERRCCRGADRGSTCDLQHRRQWRWCFRRRAGALAVALRRYQRRDGLSCVSRGGGSSGVVSLAGVKIRYRGAVRFDFAMVKVINCWISLVRATTLFSTQLMATRWHPNPCALLHAHITRAPWSPPPVRTTRLRGRRHRARKVASTSSTIVARALRAALAGSAGLRAMYVPLVPCALDFRSRNISKKAS